MKLAKIWFREAKNLEINAAIFLRVANKTEQTELAAALEKEKASYSSIDPEKGSQFFINKTIKNLKQYVVIERKYRAPFTAFYKPPEGKLTTITIDPERNRQISLMLKDKKTQDEIEEALNGLTDNELKEFFKGEER